MAKMTVNTRTFPCNNQYGAEYDTSMNFIYDTIKPSYTDLVLSGGNIEYPVTENSIISNSFNSVQVKYTDITSGIHFPNITSIALYDPDNNLITGNHSYIGQGDDRVCRWAFKILMQSFLMAQKMAFIPLS